METIMERNFKDFENNKIVIKIRHITAFIDIILHLTSGQSRQSLFSLLWVELLRYLCILVIIDKNYRQMIDILHSTACVIALYKIIEAALITDFDKIFST